MDQEETTSLEQYAYDDTEAVKILLIDLENCPNQILELQDNLEQYTKVIICYAKTGVKIPLDWLMPLSSTVVERKLHIHKMANISKNSADFGICFFAGALMQQYEKKARFTIISNDTDLDHVVSLLKSQGCTAERIGTKKIVKTNNDQVNLKISYVQLYCSHLIAHSKNRPAKKETLLKSIKSKFKDNPELSPDILRILMEMKAVSIIENKILYHDDNIEKIITANA
ncbi:MAG: NYN domain-containing protein [Candidatus Electrothrix sp. AUS4]|nr:NYN domain-containing protein [Candidatus Electrothrix sp. AUS4]